jgi:hypothetical protein
VEIDDRVKLAIYQITARSGHPPAAEDVAREIGASMGQLAAAYARLAARRLLVLEADGLTIRMAPPFSGVATQHLVRVGRTEYFANCAWDALGIPAALHAPGEIESGCAQSGERLLLHVGVDGPHASDWLFHCQIPASRWWQDIVFT